jgi:hypothetical protein
MTDKESQLLKEGQAMLNKSKEVLAKTKEILPGRMSLKKITAG